VGQLLTGDNKNNAKNNSKTVEAFIFNQRSGDDFLTYWKMRMYLLYSKAKSELVLLMICLEHVNYFFRKEFFIKTKKGQAINDLPLYEVTDCLPTVVFVKIVNDFNMLVVEAAGVEPASENDLPWLLHTYPEL
jgi:hypothetical protein